LFIVFSQGELQHILAEGVRNILVGAIACIRTAP
jgi:hypothetical protein